VALRRADDAVDKIEHRMELYHATADTLASYYRRRGLLADVDGEGDEGEVARRVECAVMRAAVAREDLGRLSFLAQNWHPDRSGLRPPLPSTNDAMKRSVNGPRWARRAPT
jgi:hypothetical protein